MSAARTQTSFFVIQSYSKDSEPRVVCQISNSRITGVVFFFLGHVFLATSLYLLLGGIGTIPALSTGYTFLALGVGFAFGGAYLFFKSLKNIN
jgi:hypothetical protein